MLHTTLELLLGTKSLILHITYQLLLRTIVPNSTITHVTLPNGLYAKIINIGSAMITQKLQVHNVHCASLFHVDLHFVS